MLIRKLTLIIVVLHSSAALFAVDMLDRPFDDDWNFLISSSTLPAFNGLCQVVLRAKKGQTGKATLRVASDKLVGGDVTISTR